MTTRNSLKFVAAIVVAAMLFLCCTVGYAEDVKTGTKAGDRMVLTIKGVEYAFRWCPPGTFTMGSPASEQSQVVDLYPKSMQNSVRESMKIEVQRQVTLSQGFWLLETEVTQSMWENVTGKNPSHSKGNKKFPVENLSWEDCQEYIRKLNDLGIAPSGFKFSLPTESQWEYACRAGTTTPFHFGIALNGDKANCNGEYPYGTETKGKNLAKTTEVGSYVANAWGLQDMHGNVSEWCLDWFETYPSENVTDPVGATIGSYRVLRGGVWFATAGGCRSAARYRDVPSGSNGSGLRLALVRE